MSIGDEETAKPSVTKDLTDIQMTILLFICQVKYIYTNFIENNQYYPKAVIWEGSIACFCNNLNLSQQNETYLRSCCCCHRFDNADDIPNLSVKIPYFRIFVQTPSNTATEIEPSHINYELLPIQLSAVRWWIRQRSWTCCCYCFKNSEINHGISNI